MSLKDNTFRCLVINRPDSPYFEAGTMQKVSQFLQTETNKGKLKQTGKLFLLIANNMNSMEEMHRFLLSMHNYCLSTAAIPA